MAKSKTDDDETFEGGDATVMVDLTNVEEATFENIPRGTYSGVIAQCDYGLSNNSGQPMWTLQLQITEGEYEGRKLFTHMSFSPKALPLTKKALMQIAPELASTAFDPREAAADMEGKVLRFKVTIEPYEGEKRNRVKQLLAPGDSEAFMTS